MIAFVTAAVLFRVSGTTPSKEDAAARDTLLALAAQTELIRNQQQQVQQQAQQGQQQVQQQVQQQGQQQGHQQLTQQHQVEPVLTELTTVVRPKPVSPPKPEPPPRPVRVSFKICYCN